MGLRLRKRMAYLVHIQLEKIECCQNIAFLSSSNVLNNCKMGFADNLSF